MIYSRSYLNSLKIEDLKVPLQRYFHKFLNGELEKLKMHEKDFFFQNLKLFYNNESCKGRPAYDLRKIKEAKRYCFYSIILTYANEYIDFDTPNYGYKGKIPANEVRKDKRFFYEYINTWKNQVNSKKGSYFSQIEVELKRKLKALLSAAQAQTITKKEYDRKVTLFWAIFFHIYYKVKIYFDEKKAKFEELKISGYNIRFDIYSYIHILSRHYYPSMNDGMGVSFNSKQKAINLDELPTCILSLVDKHTKVSGLSIHTEFLLYEIEGEKYILWIKYISQTGFSSFQVRSFYKCESQLDFDKFIGKTKAQIEKNIFAYY